MCGTFFRSERAVRFIRPQDPDYVVVTLGDSDEENEDIGEGEVDEEVEGEEVEHEFEIEDGEEDEDGEEEEDDDDEGEDDIFILDSEDDLSEADDITELHSSSQVPRIEPRAPSMPELERYEVIGNQLVPIRDTTHSNYSTNSENNGPLQKRPRTSTPKPAASRLDNFLFSEEAENNYESKRTERASNLPGKSIFMENSPIPQVEQQLEDVERTLLVELPEAPEHKSETVNSSTSQHFATSLENDGGQSSSGRIPPNSERKVILIDKTASAGSQPLSQPTASGQVRVPKLSCFISFKPNFDVVVRTENGTQSNTQVVNCPFLLENKSGRDISCFIVPAKNGLGPGTRPSTSRTSNSASDANPETLTLTEGLNMTPIPHSSSSPLEDSNSTPSQTGFDVNLEEENVENGAGASVVPHNWEHDYSRGCASSPRPAGSNLVHLGDPRRNVLIDSHHLTVAQQKSDPEQAICYLVGNLFSKELMICNLADFKNYRSLDQNKMAAIREYVATLFPHYDFRKCGKDCENYVFYVKCLMAFAASTEVEETPQNNPGSSVDTTVPRSEAVRENRHHHVESRSQVPQPSSSSQMKKTPSGQEYASVVVEDKDDSSSNDSVEIKVLDYFGNPRRNVLLPVEVMTVARGLAHPQHSAKYLIQELFSKDDLMRSNVYGHLRLGLTPLNANKINALREFLQEAFPDYHLSEAGCDWRFCVTTINSFLCSLRNNSGNASFRNNMTEESRDSESTD